MLFDTKLNNFGGHISSEKENKNKTKQMVLHQKLKSFCTAKETTNKTKRQPTER